MKEFIPRAITVLDTLRLYPWPREDSDKDLIAELKSRGYVVIPIEDLLEGNIELLKKVFP
jgi:hypothetical protein